MDRDAHASARAGSTTRTCSRSRGAASPTRSRSGITTTADYSFSGAAATAAAELGLRAIVYLEVFGGDPARRGASTSEKRAPVDEPRSCGSAISPHAPYTCSLEVYRWCLSLGIPVGTHLAESANENEWLEHGTRAAAQRSPRCSCRRPASAPSRRSSPCSGRTSSAPTASRSTTARSPCSPSADVPVAHCPRSNALLGCGVAPLAELRAAGRPRRARDRLAGVRRRRSTSSRRCGRRSTPPGRASGAPRRSCAADALALATRDAARALRIDGRGGYPDARQARRPDGRVARGKPLPSGRGSRSGRRLRRLAGTSARDDRRRTDPVPKRGRGHSGERYAAPQAPPGAECSRRGSSGSRRKRSRSRPQWQEELFFQRLRNHAKWAYVFLAVAFVLGFVLLGVGSGSTGLSDVFQSAFDFGLASGGTSIGSLRRRSTSTRRTRPPGATSRRPTSRSSAPQEAVSALERYTALKPKDADGLAELAAQYATLSRTYATDYQNAQLEGASAIARGGVRAARDDGVREDLRRPEGRCRIRSRPRSSRRRRRSSRPPTKLPDRAAERRGDVQEARGADPRRRHASSTSSARRRRPPATTRRRSRRTSAS